MIACAGEIVTCENGHECFRVGGSIEPHAVLSHLTFEPLGDQPRVNAGQTIRESMKCSKCGGVLMRQRPSGMWEIHIGHEWRA